MDVYIEISDDVGGSSALYGSYYKAQTFTPAVAITFDGFGIWISKYGTNPDGNLLVSLCSVDGSNKPSDIIETKTLAPGSINYANWTQLDFTNCSLEADTKYAVVLSSPDSNGITPYRMYASTESYGGGTGWTSTDSGGSWSDYGADYPLRVYGEAAAASKPTNPTPSNDGTEIDFSDLTLSWVDGGGADTYDVYMGTTGNLTLLSEAQAETSFTVTMDDVPDNQVIYWRVDATNDNGTTTGDEWNFDARPGAVTVTVPADEATGITLDETTGSWAASANADTYSVYFGTLSGFTSLVETTSEVSSVLTSGNFSNYGDIYYWKVKATNDFGTTDSDEFWFTTIKFDPPLPSGITWTYSTDSGPGVDAEDEDGVPVVTVCGTANGLNFINTVGILIAITNNTLFYGDNS